MASIKWAVAHVPDWPVLLAIVVSPNACCAAVEARGTIVLVSVAAGVTGGMLALRFNRSTSPPHTVLCLDS